MGITCYTNSAMQGVDHHCGHSALLGVRDATRVAETCPLISENAVGK